MANNVFKTRKEEQKGILLLTTPDGDKYVITGNRDLLINLKDKFVTGNIREEDLNGFVVRKKVDNSLIKCSEDDKKGLLYMVVKNFLFQMYVHLRISTKNHLFFKF
ncbi:MAG: hypothetical protein QXF35_01085 [Candidatus Bilamarchaeaceae archaeon]